MRARSSKIASQCLLSRPIAQQTPQSLSRQQQRRSISAYGYEQAKSLVYSHHGSPSDVLSLHSHSLPPPHGNLLTLRTLAAPLNPADINQIQGSYPSLPPFTQTLGTPQASAVPGNEACFEVLATGSSVTTVKKGDWVIPQRTGLGTWRTHLQVPETAVMQVEKEGLTPLQVGTVMVNPVTAYQMLQGLQPGVWWIQNGANSGVGRVALQLGRKWGLKGIAIVRRREDEKEMRALVQELKELGAEEVVASEVVPEQYFWENVQEWTKDAKGKGVRLGLNCVGGREALDMAKVLGESATMITYGGMSKAPMRLGAAMLIFKDLRFTGFWVSRWGDQNPDDKKNAIRDVLRMYREGSFRDGPFVQVPWSWETGKEELVNAAQGTLEGFRKGKGIFVFKDT